MRKNLKKIDEGKKAPGGKGGLYSQVVWLEKKRKIIFIMMMSWWNR